ncbi:MAG: ABC transporter permease [Anaerolineae bacterium]
MKNASRSWGWLIIGLVAAVLVTGFISFRLFNGSVETMAAQADYGNIILVNVLVGISVALFIFQLKWGALRVALTVVGALLLGYIVTAFFNLDTAQRFVRGQFEVTVVSKAVPQKVDGVDLVYGDIADGEFNKSGVRTPLTEARYTFQGSQGDVISALAYAANRRSTVDLQIDLSDASGTVIASATTSTTEQRELFEDMRSDRDAVIQDFTLPANGVYTLDVRPEAVSLGTTLDETIQATNTAYDAFLLGALGRVNRWAVWIQDALTLILVGLAIALAFRANQFSLGAEGQLYLGALASGVVALAWGNMSPWLVVPIALLASITAGFVWGLIPGVLKAYLNANELVSTLMLNTIAIRFYDLVLTFQLKPPEAGYIATDSFSANAIFPPIVAETQVTVAVFIVIAAVIAVWLLLTRTPLGYEIRMVGANQKFADYGGVNTKRTIMLAMAVSGILAGLAGAHLSMGIYRQLLINISIGLAFEGVVVALLARNDPLVIPFTGFLYAYLRAGAQFMERDANVSFEVVRIIQAAIILLITAEALTAFFQQRRTRQKNLHIGTHAPESAKPAVERSANG